nr:sporulation initiation factor Spo0A C-terminal domain-containing protein [uncultured Sellimonas sp.]
MENLSQLIHRLGINATYRGYHYLYRAVLLALSNEEYLLSITKKMYLDIASYYHTPVSNVERNLRTVITICWERGNRELLTQIASYPLVFKPSAGEFIDILVAYCQEHNIRN